jgi:hypothetical protein
VRSKEPGAFAHLVYATEDSAMTATIAAASKDKHAEWIFVTQGVAPHPWGLAPEPALYDHPGLERNTAPTP